jgi:hypothetical protein
MYRCQKCQRIAGPHVPEHRIATTRATNYPVRVEGDKIIDRGGFGREISSEMTVCPFCAPNEERPKAKYIRDDAVVMLRSDLLPENTKVPKKT